jgi:hypothetical protein
MANLEALGLRCHPKTLPAPLASFVAASDICLGAPESRRFVTLDCAAARLIEGSGQPRERL